MKSLYKTLLDLNLNLLYVEASGDEILGVVYDDKCESFATIYVSVISELEYDQNLSEVEKQDSINLTYFHEGDTAAEFETHIDSVFELSSNGETFGRNSYEPSVNKLMRYVEKEILKKGNGFWV